MTDTITSGANLGTGIGLYTSEVGGVLNFKTLQGGPGIILNANDTTITVEYVGMGKGGLIAFSKIAEAPKTIQPLGILFGSPNGHLAFTAAPTAAGTSLVYNGSGFVWQPSTSGTVTSVTLAAAPGIQVSGGSITSSGTLTVGLATSGVTPGLYTNPSVQIDAYGRVLSATSQINGEINTVSSVGGGASVYLQKTGSDIQLRSIRGAGSTSVTTSNNEIVISSVSVTNVNVTGDGNVLVQGAPITSTGTVALSLSKTGVTPGTYSAASIIVDAMGRIIGAQSNDIGEINTAVCIGKGVNLLAGKSGTELQFRSVSAAGSLTIDNSDPSNIVFDVAPSVTSVNLLAGSGLQVSGGPITGSGSFTVGLAPSGVIAGSYGGTSTIVIDEYGRVISASTTPAAAGVSFSSSADIAVSAGPAYSLALAPTTVTPGTYAYPTITIDNKGRVILATDNSDTIANLSVSLTGDATGSGLLSSAINVTLADTGVVAGTYSSPDITIDRKGRITAISSSATIAAVDVLSASSIPPTGVAAGSYNNASFVVGSDGRITAASSSPAALVPTGGLYGQVLTQAYPQPTWTSLPTKVVPDDFPAVTSWRLSITSIDGGDNGMLAIQNIDFRSIIGGSTITIPGSVLSTDPGWGTDVPANAFNGSSAPYVASTSFTPTTGLVTIGYQYESAVVVRDFSITASTLPGYFAPTDFSIQYLYNGAWVTAWTLSSPTPWAPGETRSFPSTNGTIDEAFRTLADTPNSYLGCGMSHLRVNQAETAIEFVPMPRISGRSSERPVYGTTDVGIQYFDSTINLPIWWTGYQWVNAMGAVA